MNTSLDLDIGNSRTKWRCGSSRGVLCSPEIPQLDVAIDRVRIASVAIEQSKVREAVASTYGVVPKFAESTEHLAGVTNGYDDPATLGVDRWLALVAAWNRVRQATVVVDAGTALTLDVVADRGVHLGGYIVPGLSIMKSSLSNNTLQVQPRQQSRIESNTSPGSNTEQAVEHGLLSMIGAWIVHCTDKAEEVCESAPVVFLSGGDRETLARVVSMECQLTDDLVLEGLELALP